MHFVFLFVFLLFCDYTVKITPTVWLLYQFVSEYKKSSLLSLNFFYSLKDEKGPNTMLWYYNSALGGTNYWW